MQIGHYNESGSGWYLEKVDVQAMKLWTLTTRLMTSFPCGKWLGEPTLVRWRGRACSTCACSQCRHGWRCARGARNVSIRAHRWWARLEAVPSAMATPHADKVRHGGSAASTTATLGMLATMHILSVERTNGRCRWRWAVAREGIDLANSRKLMSSCLGPPHHPTASACRPALCS